MNLEKYAIAEEGILSKLKEKFSRKSNKDIISQMNKPDLDAEIKLRKNEFSLCIKFLSNALKNKKYYYTKFNKFKIKLASISSSSNEYDYFKELESMNNANLWVGDEEVSIGYITADWNSYYKFEDTEDIFSGFHDLTSDFNTFIENKNFKCVSKIGSCTDDNEFEWSIQIGPSKQFMDKFKSVENQQ